MTQYSAYMPYASEHWGSNKLSGHYAKVAEGLGAYAEQVTTPDKIALAIQRAISANENGQPAVLEMITKEEETVPHYW